MQPTAHPAAFAAALSLALASTLAAPARAQIADGPFTIELKPIASGLTAPVQIKPAPDGSGRLFVCDQAGQIRVIQNGSLLPTPFLDVSALLVPLNLGYDERGLLGIALHPDFANNGRFFVHYSRARTPNPGDPCAFPPFGCNTEVIAEYTVTPPSANVANPAGTILYTIDKPQFNHNGGGIAFGPDGYLYFSFGDGGGANDGLSDTPPSHGPTGNAQNLGIGLGKMHRYDVSTPGMLKVPPTNPFVFEAGAVPGIFALGFRNPYDFSFDDFGPGATALIVADVGQDAFEEVDIVEVGNDMGWPVREGFHCFDPFATHTPPATCQSFGFIPPILEYPHADPANNFLGLAVIGGILYRGSAFPGLHGQYLFGDFSTSFGAADGHLFHADMNTGPGTPGPMLRLKLGAGNRTLAKFVKGIGRDAAGEVYVLVSDILGPAGTSGQVMKIVPCTADFNASGTVGIQDLFDFLGAFFIKDPRADINNSGMITVQDVFDYLGAFFTGC